MTAAATKAKLSVTISRELLDAVDREVARHPGSTRSGVIESWLRLASRTREEELLHRQTVAYYQARQPEELLDEEEWATFASDEFLAVAETA
jgi:metal-responsive CopG/Arc/MetJ family transcriptional regulator